MPHKARAQQPTPHRAMEQDIKRDSEWDQNRMILAEHGPTPRQADPEPGFNRFNWVSQRDLQPVDREQPEKKQRAVRQGKRRDRQPVIPRNIERKRRQEARPGPVRSGRHTRQQPARGPKKDDEADPECPGRRARC